MSDSVAVARELGGLAEAVRGLTKRAGEDRDSQNDATDKLQTTVEALRREVAAIGQTAMSTGTQVASIAQEHTGERVKDLERSIIPDGIARIHALERVSWPNGVDEPSICDRIEVLELRSQKLDKWFGTGWAFVGKLVLVLVGSAAVSGGLFSLFAGMAAWVGAHWNGTPR